MLLDHLSAKHCFDLCLHFSFRVSAEEKRGFLII